MSSDDIDSGSPIETPARVDVRRGLTDAEFIDRYVCPNEPVVIEDATRGWRALDTWTPEFFRNRYGDRPAGDTGLSFAELIDRITGKVDASGPCPYLRNVSIDQAMPELRSDMAPEPSVLTPNWFTSRLVPPRIARNRTDLFIGGPGSTFPFLHFDNYHGYAFIFQIFGAKQFVLIPPDQSAYVYARSTDNGVDNVSSVDDPLDPDLTRFPLFAHATPISLELTAGQSLFIPAGWWHTARMLEPSISVSSNVANRHNWARLEDDFRRSRSARPIERIIGGRYLAIVRHFEMAREAVTSMRRSRRLRG